MNNPDVVTFLMFTWFLMGLSGVFLYKSIQAIFAFKEMLRRRKEYPYVERATDQRMCKGPHKWDQTKLALGALPTGKYTVCTECGYVSGQNVMLNAPGMEVYRNNIKIRDERRDKWNKLFQVKQQRTDEIMRQQIKACVADLGSDLHKNIEVLEQFFRKSNIELESLYSKLNKEYYDEENG
jgi:hypothetical protein